MPMLASACVVSPGICLGFAGFSANSTIRSSASTAITPKPLASSSGTLMQATVISALFLAWHANI